MIGEIDYEISWKGCTWKDVEQAMNMMDLYRRGVMSEMVFDGVDIQDIPTVRFDSYSSVVSLHVGGCTLLEEEGKLVLFLTCEECDAEASEKQYKKCMTSDCTGCKEIMRQIKEYKT